MSILRGNYHRPSHCRCNESGGKGRATGDGKAQRNVEQGPRDFWFSHFRSYSGAQEAKPALRRGRTRRQIPISILLKRP